jgi:hypothetical protein
VTDWTKRAAADPLLSDALRGAGMILDISAPKAAEAVACALRAHDADRAALTALHDVSPVWEVLDETHLRRMRELMEDKNNKPSTYAVTGEKPRPVHPEIARLRAQLEEARQELYEEREKAKFEASIQFARDALADDHNRANPATSETSLFGSIMREVGKHAAHGAKAELSTRAQKAIVSGVRQLAPQLPQSPVYDAAIAVLAPVMLLAAGRVAQEYMDLDEGAFAGKLLAGVTEGAGLALEGTSKETVRSVVSGAAPALMQLAAVTRPELSAGGYDDE